MLFFPEPDYDAAGFPVVPGVVGDGFEIDFFSFTALRGVEGELSFAVSFRVALPLSVVTPPKRFGSNLASILLSFGSMSLSRSLVALSHVSRQ